MRIKNHQHPKHMDGFRSSKTDQLLASPGPQLVASASANKKPEGHKELPKRKLGLRKTKKNHICSVKMPVIISNKVKD